MTHLASKDHPHADLIAAVEWFASTTPREVAASDNQTHLSYAQLLQAVSGLEQELRAAGVLEGNIIAVRMSRSVLYLIACLAVLRLGASFLPLDPIWPQERQSEILRDAQADLLLLEQQDTEAKPDCPFRILDLNQPWTRGQTNQRTAEPDPVRIVYVLYTSGSTGAPKGVPISTAALMNYLQWASQSYIHEGAGSVVQTSIGADLTITSLFAPLLCGKKVHMHASDDPSEFASYLRTRPCLSFIKLTPSGLRLLSSTIPARDIALATTRLIIGGEQLTHQILSGISDARGLRVVNEYGPTEATVGCTTFSFQIGDDVPDPVPIGRPIPGMDVRLSADNALTEANELYISGVGVAKGYRNASAHDNIAFAIHDGKWTYATGDLAWADDAGELHFIGRKDRQLKIRGYRVEPAEVEAVINSFPGVSHAVAVPVKASATFLSAFVVPNGEPDAHLVPQLEEYLKSRLSPYSVPDRIEMLAELPLTPSGKIDIEALDRRSRETLPSGIMAQQTSGDRISMLARVWAEVLGRPAESSTDSFFANGGDSIKAFHFCIAARRRGIHLTVKDVLLGRSLVGMAARGRDVMPVNEVVEESGFIPLSPQQNAFLRLHSNAPHSWAIHWSMKTDGDLDIIRLRTAADKILSLSPALRSRFFVRDGRWRGELGELSRSQLDVVSLEGADAPHALQAWLKDAINSFQLETGPLVRVLYLSFADRSEGSITCVAHHLVADMVSLQIMCHQILASYSGQTIDGPTRSYREWLRLSSNEPSFDFQAGITEQPAWEWEASIEPSLARRIKAHLSEAQLIAPTIYAGLCHAMSDSSEDTFSVTLESNGRYTPTAPGDFNSITGWLTRYELLTIFAGESHARKLVQQIASRSNVTLPDGLLPEVAFNYLGEIPTGEAFAVAGARIMDRRPLENVVLLFKMEVVSWFQGETLHFRFRYLDPSLTAAMLASFVRSFSLFVASYLEEREVETLSKGAGSLRNFEKIHSMFGPRDK